MRVELDLDTMKAMMGQQQFDEKLDQNEELANLRADTSLKKTNECLTQQMADKKFDFGRNFKKKLTIILKLKELNMVKKTKNGANNVKVVPELGANAKGEQQGGIPVEMTDPMTSK